MFSEFHYIDTTLWKDITKEDDAPPCMWFTLPVGVYPYIDEETGEERDAYEYVSFPQTATSDKHILFYTSDKPYFYFGTTD